MKESNFPLALLYCKQQQQQQLEKLQHDLQYFKKDEWQKTPSIAKQALFG
jgi:hypothetical protein